MSSSSRSPSPIDDTIDDTIDDVFATPDGQVLVGGDTDREDSESEARAVPRAMLFAQPPPESASTLTTNTTTPLNRSLPSRAHRTQGEHLLDMQALAEAEDEADDLRSDDDSVAYNDDENLDALVEGAALATMEKIKMLATDDDGGGAALVALDEFHYHSHKAPDDYVVPPANPGIGLPEFSTVDNPGKWPSYTFFPKFFAKKTGDKKRGDYSHHATSTGAQPVPLDSAGERKCGGWRFFYEGWRRSDDFPAHRSGSTASNLFPEERKGFADYGLMSQLVLSRTQAPCSRCLLLLRFDSASQ